MSVLEMLQQFPLEANEKLDWKKKPKLKCSLHLAIEAQSS